MLTITIILRRLFSTKPAQCDLTFAWWFVKGGERRWSEELEFLFGTRTRLVMALAARERKLLETWDTAVYQAWVHGEGPGGDPGPWPMQSWGSWPPVQRPRFYNSPPTHSLLTRHPEAP